MEAHDDKPIVWREFGNKVVGDIKVGDIVMLDPIWGPEHVTELASFEEGLGRNPSKTPPGELDGSLMMFGPVVRMVTEARSLAFPRLSSGSDERYVRREVLRGSNEPVLIIHVVHPRNPKAGSLG